MRTWLHAAAGALIAFGASSAQAAPISVDPLVAAHDLAPKQDVQYFFGGRSYCFYPDGWRGPGFYWCGYNWRRGYGWGGPMGWRGWGGAPGPGFYNQPRYYGRGPDMRPGYRRDYRRERF